MRRLSALLYLVVTSASAALVTVQPEPVAETQAAVLLDGITAMAPSTLDGVVLPGAAGADQATDATRASRVGQSRPSGHPKPAPPSDSGASFGRAD